MGVMKFTKTVVKNLFSTPVTNNYPAVQPEYKPRTRGKVAIDFDQCIFCGACQRKCPAGAIVVDRAARKWTIERMGCIQCGNCVYNCPKKCLSMDRYYTEPSTEKKVDTYERPWTEEELAAEAAKKEAAKQAALKKAAEMKAAKEAAAKAAAAKQVASNEKTAAANADTEKGGDVKPAGMTQPVPEVKAAPEVLVIPGKPHPDLSKCVYCTICAKFCPVGAITVDRPGKTWTMDPDTCVECGVCVTKCPKKCIEMAE